MYEHKYRLSFPGETYCQNQLCLRSFMCYKRDFEICPPVTMGVYGAYYLFIYLFLIFLLNCTMERNKSWDELVGFKVGNQPKPHKSWSCPLRQQGNHNTSIAAEEG